MELKDMTDLAKEVFNFEIKDVHNVGFRVIVKDSNGFMLSLNRNRLWDLWISLPSGKENFLVEFVKMGSNNFKEEDLIYLNDYLRTFKLNSLEFKPKVENYVVSFHEQLNMISIKNEMGDKMFLYKIEQDLSLTKVEDFKIGKYDEFHYNNKRYFNFNGNYIILSYQNTDKEEFIVNRARRELIKHGIVSNNIEVK